MCVNPTSLTTSKSNVHASMEHSSKSHAPASYVVMRVWNKTIVLKQIVFLFFKYFKTSKKIVFFLFQISNFKFKNLKIQFLMLKIWKVRNFNK